MSAIITLNPAPRPTKAQLEALVAGLSDSLSPREIEVCARALLGMTRNGIGLDLGVKPTTVNTLSRRAYEKLNISSIHELFAMCLAAGSPAGSPVSDGRATRDA